MHKAHNGLYLTFEIEVLYLKHYLYTPVAVAEQFPLHSMHLHDSVPPRHVEGDGAPRLDVAGALRDRAERAGR